MIIVLTVSVVSAGTLKDFFKKMGITGKADSANVALNISVSGGTAPVILAVYNETISSTVLEGPSATYVIIVINVSDADGPQNLNNVSAKVNITSLDGISAIRQNTSCVWVIGQSTTNSVNFSCNVTMWWWDKPGLWNISAYVADLSGNVANNISIKTLTLGTTDGLTANDTALSWATISPGAINQQSIDYIVLNNTGNRYRSILVNATDLIGEVTTSQALGASNFSVKNAAGCEGTAMVNWTATNVTTALNFFSGNYTYNNGTSQQNLYFCIEESNSDLSAQSYSTAAFGTWTLKVG
jgi:hypothetical protein